MHKTLLNNTYNVTSYVFRVHFEEIDYCSRAYLKKHQRPPQEEKYSGVWAEDQVKNNFVANYPGEVIHADIKYLKILGCWWFLHILTETFSNKILTYELTLIRNAEASILLLEQAKEILDYYPRMFHSDHGREYANYQFKQFLDEHWIIQSMSPKGNSLANRPSEYLFALIQKEKLDYYPIAKMSDQEVKKIIDKFVDYYNNFRVQSNLEYKTPQEVFFSYGACV